MAVANQYGRHDHEFCDKVPEELICNICTKPLFEPHLTVCCGQYYCESCLKYWFKRQKKKSCPHCRAVGVKFQHVPNKAIERKVNELKIHCTNHKDGCQWVGELSNSQFHLNSDEGCGYVEVNCTKKCGEKVKRKDLSEHIHSHCLLRQYRCKYCGYTDTYHAITAECGSKGQCDQHDSSHYQTCPNYPLECPNKCEKVIQRKDMDEHCKQCLLGPVKCPFKDAGCNAKLIRKEFESHMTSNTQQHLLLVMASHQELESTVRELQMARTSTLASVDTYLKTCTEDQKPHLQSIKTLAQSYRLKENKDSIAITMMNISHHKRSRKVWHSPPFYYKEGYKMCLEVQAIDMESDPRTHISLSVLLMKGEFDDKLEWPIVFDSLVVGLTEHQLIEPPYHSVLSKCVGVSTQVIMRGEMFANRTVMKNCLSNDSLTFFVSLQELISQAKSQKSCIFSPKQSWWEKFRFW